MKKITWIIIVILLLIAGFMQACGSRKSTVAINKQTESIKENSTTESSQEIRTESENKSEESEKVDKSEEKQEKKVTEKFNDNGTIKERTTETFNSKSTDKTTKDKKSKETIKTSENKIVNQRIENTNKITKYIKDKKTESSNLYLIIGSLLLIAFIGFLAFRYFKK